MKAVAFVCMLSLSLCLSQPTTQPDAHAAQAVSPVKNDEKALTPVKPDEKAVHPTIATTINIVTTSTEKPTHPTENASQPPTSNQTKTTDVKPQDNKTDKTPEKEEATKTNESKPPAAPKNDTNSKAKPAETKPSEEAKAPEETKMAGKDKEATTTQKAVTVKPSEAPKDTTEKPLVASRGFDGASFIGGMVLTLGLLAIGFMGFKYYKNQTERNYHTL